MAVLTCWSKAEAFPTPLPMPQTADARSQAAPATSNAATSEPVDSTAGLSKEDPTDRENRLGPSLLKHIFDDQREIWTSPWNLRVSDATWLLPVAGVAASLFATDRQFSRSLSSSPSRISTSQSLSNYGVAALAGAGGAIYLWGKLKSDDHAVETAILSGEAALNSLLVVEGLKYTAGRDRPYQDGGGGRFFQGGSSFPSEHSAVAWSIAGVIAHEYPGRLTDLFAYGLATTVSLSRVTAKQHFPSDVFIGGVMAWWISKEIYRAHHRIDLGGAGWQTPREAHEKVEHRRPADWGSPYVPLDSWVYAAFERLSTMGYVSVAKFSIKPWTRIECADLTEQVSDALVSAVQREVHPPEDAVRLEGALRAEFGTELAAIATGPNQNLRLDSLYSRVTSISGPPLTDGFHFGQTISYDDGRPDRQGTNAIAGAEVSGAEGPLAFYVQAEYQHAPSAPALSSTVRNVIATVDHTPLQPAEVFAEVNRLDLLQGYVAYAFQGWQLSAGKQELSWGPSTQGSLMYGSNAEPFPMIRLTQLRPPEFRGFLRYLWPARVDNIFGRLEGHTFLPRPFLFGQKVTFEWGPYFEFSYARNTVIGGQGGDPLNATTFGELFFGTACSVPACVTKGAPPGASNTGSDITVRVPGTHGTALLYLDLYSEDDAFAWRALGESIYRPGLYISRLPGLPRVDFRIEYANSETPFFADKGAYGVSYFDSRYINYFTNAGFLMGNTVGRDGQTSQVSSTYWFSPQKTLQLTYKDSSVNPKFIPQGGKWQDYGVNYQMRVRAGLSIKGAVQFEHISHYPILFHGPANNVTGLLELGYRPQGGLNLLGRSEGTRSSDLTGAAAQ
jgi:membrane-associated phospholipid phosphatase